MTTYCVTFGQRYRRDPHPVQALAAQIDSLNAALDLLGGGARD